MPDPVVAPVAPVVPVVAPVAPVVPTWTDGLTADHTNLIAARQWKGVPDVIDSYHALEKLRGVPADRLVTIPADDKPESWGAVYDRLGRPKEAKGYEITVPEGGDPKFAEQAAAWFHEQGLSKKQAQGVVAKWNEHQIAAAKADGEARSAKNAQEHEALKVEWGAAQEQNLAVAKSAAKTFGFDAAKIDALEKVLGYGGVIKMFHDLGTKIGEGSFVAGQKPGFDGMLTPAQATAKIAALQNDADWRKRYMNGGSTERAEMERLQQMRAAV